MTITRRESAVDEQRWTFETLEARLATAMRQLDAERSRRELAEAVLQKMRAKLARVPEVEPARAAYADVAGRMRELKLEPPPGTSAWKRWLNRCPEDEWKAIQRYVEDMARPHVTWPIRRREDGTMAAS